MNPQSAEFILSKLSGVKDMGRGQWEALCPGHKDRDPSLSISLVDDRILLKCHAGCSIEDILKPLEMTPADLFLNGRKPHVPKASKRTTTTRHEIRDSEGKLQAIHVRRDTPNGKRFHWEQPDGTRGLGGRPTASLPLYGTERLPDLPDGAEVGVCEGEKAARSLLGAGIPAVGTVTGADGTPDLNILRCLLRFRVTLWPDNDDAGQRHMNRIAARFSDLGVTPRMVSWPDAPPKGDAADAIASGVDVAKLLAEAREWEAPAHVDLSLLLEDIHGFIRRFVATGGAQLAALALWVAHTWTMDAAECTAYLHITSPEKQSGKTRLLETLNQLGANPWQTSRASAAVLVRKVARDAPTLLLDETDSAFRADKEYSEALRGILNAGYRRGGAASLCVKNGADFELVDFPVFCPKALAGIGELPDTVADRAIRIALKRRAPSETVERFRLRDVKGQAKPIRDRLDAWSGAAIVPLDDARPELPDGISDRAADVWEPLLAIADLAGGLWPGRAREAALVLSTGAGDSSLSLGVRLLHDVRALLGERTEPVASSDLIDGLLRLEESPWGDLRGKPLDARRLSRLLRPYDIRPRQLRMGNAVLRGYHPGEFRDAFERYCYTPDLSATDATSATESEAAVNVDSESVADVPLVADTGGIETPDIGERVGGVSARQRRYTDALLMDPADVIELWRSHDCPVIPVGRGVTISNLEKRLATSTMTDDELAAVRRWLDAVRGIC